MEVCGNRVFCEFSNHDNGAEKYVLANLVITRMATNKKCRRCKNSITVYINRNKNKREKNVEIRTKKVVITDCSQPLEAKTGTPQFYFSYRLVHVDKEIKLLIFDMKKKY